MKYRPRKFSRHSIMYVKEESSDHSDDDSFVPSSGSDPGSSSHEDNEYAEFLAEKEAEEAVIKQKKKCTRRKKKRKGPLLLWEIWEEEQDRWVDDHLTEDVDLDHQHGVPIKTLEAPPDLNISLLRYQKEWLDWALKQEDSPTKGGILADEMGMGKTIQAIALVLAKREHRTPIPDQPSSSSGGLPEGLTAVKGTLVICPVVALTQWASEIDRFTSRGSTRVLVYHGPNRVNSVNQLMDYDFVITTYSIVEYDFRKFVMVPKKICPYCGDAYNKKGLLLHLRFYCGPNAAKTESQSKQEKKKLKPHADYKDNKKRPKKKALESEISGKGKSPLVDTAGSLAKEDSLLHSVMWDRIILDEAHFVKDRRCNTARAVLALESSYKWALSGTPLQNRVGELYSLIRFLRIVPYSYYLCKDCDCRTLDYSESGSCPNCVHKSVRHFCWWNKYVATPIQKWGNAELGRRAMVLLKSKILQNILLRRTKKGRAADLALPPRLIALRRDTMDIRETDYYESLYSESQAQFNTYIQAGTLMNNYAHIFDLLTRLRQAVNHPYLVVYSKSATLKSGMMPEGVVRGTICGICRDQAEDRVIPECGHVFCKPCLLDFAASYGQVSCPDCGKLLTVDLSSNVAHGDRAKTTVKGFRSSSILNRIQLDGFQTSTKIEALREEIRFMVERDGSAKGIVFSQFTSFLDLISYSLHKSGVKCVQLVGTMAVTAKDAAIKRFTEDRECKIFLMSLKAGGVALNLTVASHVFLMDPWWNPAVERQAQDRIHRIGQYKPIRSIRFVIENTVEERILKLQEKKDLVFEGTVGGSADALGKLTEQDLRFLFN